ncbi:MAG: pyridoxal-dependent decarboxylase [Bdellovibrionaceae bacterium]|nr:pyridoxal-dependent decarboxylase [Pseudobdellovibrionaceae bacterium]
MSGALQDLLRSLEAETPKFTPRYIGHMVSENSLPALLAEFALLLHNPNNASKESAKVGLVLEKHGIEALARMVGFEPRSARGHFTSCGTIANFEAIWRASHWFDRKFSLALNLIERKLYSPQDLFTLCHVTHDRWASLLEEHQISEPDLAARSLLRNGPWDLPTHEILGTSFRGPVFLVPGNRHYSWPKSAAVFGLGTASAWSIDLDEEGRLDLQDLKAKIEKARREQRPILCVISVAGTTELGEVDPIASVQDLLDEYQSRENLSFWHHVDGAYGGFLTCLRKGKASDTTSNTGMTTSSESPDASLASSLLDGAMDESILRALHGIERVDSVTIDPHKLGYVPYACGAFIARDEAHYATFQVQAPYLKQSPESQSGWSSTLEGSRSAAGAAAVWLTAKTMSLDRNGFGRILTKTIAARMTFAQAIANVAGAQLVSPADTNILCFSIAPSGSTLAQANERTRAVYDRIEAGPQFSVSRTTLLRTNYAKMITRLCQEWGIRDDGVSDLLVIRLVLMNPFIVSKEMMVDFSREFANELLNQMRSATPSSGAE